MRRPAAGSDPRRRWPHRTPPRARDLPRCEVDQTVHGLVGDSRSAHQSVGQQKFCWCGSALRIGQAFSLGAQPQASIGAQFNAARPRLTAELDIGPTAHGFDALGSQAKRLGLVLHDLQRLVPPALRQGSDHHRAEFADDLRERRISFPRRAHQLRKSPWLAHRAGAALGQVSCPSPWSPGTRYRPISALSARTSPSTSESHPCVSSDPQELSVSPYPSPATPQAQTPTHL